MPRAFQRLITRIDMRVHVIGMEVFAITIASGGIDYRYSHRKGSGEAECYASEISEVAHACVRITHHLGLEFSGIDLKFADNGEVYGFEVKLHDEVTTIGCLRSRTVRPRVCGRSCGNWVKSRRVDRRLARDCRHRKLRQDTEWATIQN